MVTITARQLKAGDILVVNSAERIVTATGYSENRMVCHGSKTTKAIEAVCGAETFFMHPDDAVTIRL